MNGWQMNSYLAPPRWAEIHLYAARSAVWHCGLEMKSGSKEFLMGKNKPHWTTWKLNRKNLNEISGEKGESFANKVKVKFPKFCLTSFRQDSDSSWRKFN